jgi:Protein of unknown function (DUF3304)
MIATLTEQVSAALAKFTSATRLYERTIGDGGGPDSTTIPSGFDVRKRAWRTSVVGRKMTSNVNRARLLAACLLAVSVFSGCGKSTVSVDIHGLNYSGIEFSYMLVDPDGPDNSSVGEHIDPFAAGGTTCCYPLPKQWRPGIK